MGQFEEAGKDIEDVLSQKEADEDALRLKGRMLEALDRKEEAERVYRDLIATDPFYEQAYVDLGDLFITQNRLSDAIALFDEAIELNPNFTEAYRERGRAKLLSGDEAGSLLDAQKAVELKPQEIDVSGQFRVEENKPINILGLYSWWWGGSGITTILCRSALSATSRISAFSVQTLFWRWRRLLMLSAFEWN